MINFGIIGLGKIAHKFAQDITLVPGARLYAVASRDKLKAQEFATTHGAEHHYESYKELVNNPEVAVVYIATPNNFHYRHVLLCLQAGKAVVCEKPFAINSKQAVEMIALAQEKKLFLMEALWTRFIPATQKVLELINQGLIGELTRVTADFGFAAEQDSSKRLFNNALGGGSLLDIGIYPIYLSVLLLGYPQKINATAKMHYTNVDAECSIILAYSGGAQAVLDASFLATTPTEAIIEGTQGAIYMHPRFHHCNKLTLKINGKADTAFDLPYAGFGYTHEIAEVVKCLNKDALESPLVSHKHTQEFMKLLDGIRKQMGLVYPEDLT